MQKFTVQTILDARPNLGVELLTTDTPLVREDSGYSVEMRGFYSLPELVAIANDIKTLNTVFEEKPETDSFIVFRTETGEVIGNPFAKKTDAVDEAWRLEDETGFTDYDVKPVPTK